MKFSFTKTVLKSAPIIVPVFAKKKEIAAVGVPALDGLLKELKQKGHFEGGEGEIHVKHTESKTLPSRIVFVCLGDKEKIKGHKVLEHLSSAFKKMASEKGNEASFLLPKELNEHGEMIATACGLSNYNPAKYKTGKAQKKIKEHQISVMNVVTKAGDEKLKQLKKDFDKGRLVAEAVNEVRDCVNGPPNFSTPEFMEEKALELGKTNGYKVTVFKKKEIEKMGMGGIISVNRGSAKEARLLVLEYWPGKLVDKVFKKRPSPVVLVGKGIIFDSGGYNLKPSGHIEDMHLDKSGAAAVLGVFQLLKKLDVQVPVIGIAPITENCIDAVATKPSEIITMHNGKTVEITNTDAEGRLILGDALSYAEKTYKPRYMVDIATLTGACMVALGHRIAGVLGNDDDLIEQLKKAGIESDETVWHLPLTPDFEKAMKGEVTDLHNSDPDRYAGASKGAAFLKAFVGKTKWAHIDIAGPAYTKAPKSYETKRGTGYGVRLLLKFLENLPPHE